ncbi:MAG: hypothetical protein HWE27_07315 [Gammaproteobacteria bacterium]|nr:hypothetical protein [Gammaproteobacteria bacterium]
MKKLDQLNSESQYNLFYRSSRVFRQNDEWYFEDEAGEPFGPFDSKSKTMQAVRIYKDVKRNGISLPFESVRKIM